jgi:hypothetical protein
MQEIQTQSVLKPTKVGSNFLFDAQIRAREVAKVKKYSHQREIPKINPGTIIKALANQDTNSTVL